MSTIWNNLPTLKKLSCCVRPGLSEVRTMVVSAKLFNKLDLPTFDLPYFKTIKNFFLIYFCRILCLPTKAISSRLSGGIEVCILAPAKNESKGNYKRFRM